MTKRAKTSAVIVRVIHLAPEIFREDNQPCDEWFEGTEVLGFREFQSILSNLDPWYHPVAELMALTGITISEMAGLTTQHIEEGYIKVRRSVCGGVQYVLAPSTIWNWWHRDIRITKAIQERLAVLLKRKSGLVLATNKAGFFVDEGFERAWSKAQKNMHKTPLDSVCLHSTFVAWSLTIGISRLRLKKLCGSKSKPFIDYVKKYHLDGLAEDRDQVRAFFGNEFPD